VYSTKREESFSSEELAKQQFTNFKGLAASKEI
jgi:hypothetical protein